MLCYDNYELLIRQSQNSMANHNVKSSPNKSNSHRPLALTSPKQRQGSYFEQQACAFLQAQGLVLIAQNWQKPKVGELDLIMLETGKAWSTLVFIEVRQRRRSSFGDAALSVTKAKQRKIIKTAKYFLNQHPTYAHYDCRFDVIAYDIAQLANSINDDKGDSGKDNQPEWLIGAFIATAW
ncbi:putative endonuclease [Psychrobacter sp. LV10R520-6]|nr:YraN family protein [Psychrobacter sp. LV10R520-6]SNT70755.1 putative endonuclease [Psychrobacter sp. LV10R520-6]